MSDLLKTAHFLSCTAQTPRVGSARGLRAALIACAVAVLAVLAFSGVSPEKAYAYSETAETVKVSNVDELIEQIKISRQQQYNHNVVLTADINLTNNGDKIDQIIRELGSLTFGSKDYPFTGGFDGQGHYIIGLNYKRDLWVPAANTGLFSFTDGAYLHDINFRDCYIGADFRAGVLVGQAKNTRIESVRMVNCTLSVTPANNAVSLITNAGVMGGMIAGEMQGSSMYNCTVQGGRVVNNSVVAVSGLGGEGLYLGAMVGSAENSVIEYSRVLPTEQYYADRVKNPNLNPYEYNTGKYPYLTEVYNRYEVAVGAVAGQGVYVGGVLGYANDVDVVDCFSTAWAHTWVANYVGVGSGNIGYVGGIIAHAKSATEGANASQIIRCHFAGNMESYQWNSLAIIPIIQSNVYLAGLVERDWEEDTGLYNSYFKRNLINGMEDKIKPYPEGYVRTCGDWLGLDYSGSQSVSGYTYGPIVDDEQYKSRSFWEGEGYDFAGNIDRRPTQNTDDPIVSGDATHINKWVIDEKLGIPVHGSSVKATLDFPGAGSVEIGSSSIDRTTQVTSDPYNFAVQGVSATEAELTFTAAVDNEVGNPALSEVSHDANNGFRFQGWHRAPGVTANHIQQGSHKFFDPLVPPEPNAEQVYNSEADRLNLAYKAENTGTGDGRVTDFADNDLFVAYYQAQVLFHDVNGGVIDKTNRTTETQPSVGDDWYNHQDKLPKVAEPVADRTVGNVASNAKFLGWTTRKNATSGGWPNATSTEIDSMKAGGVFYEGGELIERPMDLYPVYADLVGQNVTVIFEGHELDSDPLTNVREKVGTAAIRLVEGGYELSVTGSETGGKLPDGYRFLGWYEVARNENGEMLDTSGKEISQDAAKTLDSSLFKTGFRLSADENYRIPAETDLVKKHTYIAKFEYEVSAWMPCKKSVGLDEWYYYGPDVIPAWKGQVNNDGLCDRFWVKYKMSSSDIAERLNLISGNIHWMFFHYKFQFWGNNDEVASRWTSEEYHSFDDTNLDYLPKVVSNYGSQSTFVTTPLDLDAIVTLDSSSIYDIVLGSDFPAATSKFAMVGKDHGEIDVTLNQQYNYVSLFRYTNNDGFSFKAAFDGPDSWNGASFTWDDKGPIWTSVHHNAYFLKASANMRFFNVDGSLLLLGSEGDPDTVKSPTTLRTKYKLPNDEVNWPNSATVTRKWQTMLFNTNGSTALEAGEHVLESSPLEERTVPVGLGAIKADQAPFDKGQYFEQDDKRYEFLGWVCPEDLTSEEMQHCFVGGAPTLGAVGYVATSRANAEPYLLQDDARVYHAMDIYPVYAEYNYDTTTNLTRGTNLTVPADPAVTATHHADQTLTLTITADSAEETKSSYDLVSWTIESPEGYVVETIDNVGGTAVSNENATLTYTIKPGQRYVFVANYETKASASLSVTYHVKSSTEQDSTTVYTKTYGDMLGKGPQPQFAGTDLDNAIFAGWTETMPITGDYHVGTDNLTLASENDVVYKSMELWPVYRAINVTANSNIDDKDPVTTNHRGVKVIDVKTGQQLDQSGKPIYTYKKAAQLWATDVEGYIFKGWYLGYASDAQPGTRVSAERDHLLSDEAAFAGNTYTAVYEKVDEKASYKIRFHIPGGKSDGAEDVRTVLVTDKGVSIVQKVQVPELDADGKPTDTKKEIEAQVYGVEETQALLALLENKSNAPGAMVYEQFKEWQWLKPGVNNAGDTVVAWNDFCKVTLIPADGAASTGSTIQEQCPGGMDLYPATYQFKAKEWEKTPTTDNPDAGKYVDYAPSNLAWYMNPAATGDEQAVKVAFKPGVLYLSDKLAINMSEAAYAPLSGSTVPAVEGVPDKKVGLYADFTDVSEKDATPLNIQTTAVENGKPEPGNVIGDAVFQFKNEGSLVIEKTAPAEADNGTFAFTVTECAADGTAVPDAKSATVYVTVKKTADGSAATGSVKLDLPWGYYRVAENGWGWQYNPTCKLLMNGFENQNLPEGVILIKSTNNQAQVTNTHNGEGFKDGEARTKNEFGQGTGGSQPTTRSAKIANPTAEGGN